MIGILDNCDLKFVGGKCYAEEWKPIYDELGKIRNIGELDRFIESYDYVNGPRLMIDDGLLVYRLYNEQNFLYMKVVYKIDGFCGWSSKSVDLKFWH